MPERITVEQRSAVMRSVRATGTGAEAAFAALRLRWRFRTQARDLPGTPDFAHDGLRVAIFVDGDFWHGRWWFERRAAPEGNRNYWIAKFERNHARDLAVDRALRRRGWAVVRIWESELRADPTSVKARLADRLAKRARRRCRRELSGRHVAANRFHRSG